MANRIKNPKEFLMATATFMEASVFRGSFTSKCEDCGSEAATLCYVAIKDKFMCPHCMKNLVRNESHLIATKEEIQNYNKFASQWGLNLSDSYGYVKEIPRNTASKFK